jgi:endoglucanase
VYYHETFLTINESYFITQCSKDTTNPLKTETCANEAYANAQFQKMKLKFIDNGYPVILGEYAAIARLSLGSAAANAGYAGFRKY